MNLWRGRVLICLRQNRTIVMKFDISCYQLLMSIDINYWKHFSFKHECLKKSTWLQITPGIQLVSFVSSVGRPVSLLRQRYRRVWPFPQGCGVGDRRQSWENPAGGVCAGERHREELKLRRCVFFFSWECIHHSAQSRAGILHLETCVLPLLSAKSERKLF